MEYQLFVYIFVRMSAVYLHNCRNVRCLITRLWSKFFLQLSAVCLQFYQSQLIVYINCKNISYLFSFFIRKFRSLTASFPFPCLISNWNLLHYYMALRISATSRSMHENLFSPKYPPAPGRKRRESKGQIWGKEGKGRQNGKIRKNQLNVRN